MVLPKKKAVASRKRVLDLLSSSSNGSPPRSTWQNRYQESPSDSPLQGNSPDCITSTTSSTSAGGLVGDYASDSDGDASMDDQFKTFMAEIEKPSNEPVASTSNAAMNHVKNSSGQSQVAGTSWLQCFDQNSGYPYYWNQVTNEVSWQAPAELLQAAQLAKKKQVNAKASPSKPVTTQKQAKKQKKTPKYPWEGNSDSEDEKIEMITSFGPPQDDGVSLNLSLPKGIKTKSRIIKKDEAIAGPHLPQGSDEMYETSSLMTPLVADVGPPGVESTPSGSAPDSSQPNGSVGSENSNDDESVLNKLRQKVKKSPDDNPTNSEMDLADEILAEIEKEIPPDFIEFEKEANGRPTESFALIASYGDDSDTDEVQDPVKPESQSRERLLFPSVSENSPVPLAAPLFPSVASPTSATSPLVNHITAGRSQTATPSPPPLFDQELPDSTTTKAFQRKRRIELIEPEPVVSSRNEEDSQPLPPVANPNPRYNMDPTEGVHRGFGFSPSESPPESRKKSNITFIKAETINEPAKALSPAASRSESPALAQDLMDGAALLREKLAFLGEGKGEVSAVQLMAIQLETLVSAWQSGSLTPEYLCQWLGSRAVELLENEQAAAPPGWICEWHRETKRYRYRNKKTGVFVWDYPEPEIEEPGCSKQTTNGPTDDNLEHEDVEMEISNTPPRASPSRDDAGYPTREPSPPPPPLIPRSDTPPPPPPPMIACKKSVRNNGTDQVSSSSEEVPPPPPQQAYPPPPSEPPPPGLEEVVKKKAAQTSSIHSSPAPPSPPDSSSQLVQSGYTQVSSSNSSVSTTKRGRKRSLISELDSFYSYLAQMDEGETSGTNSESIPAAPLPVQPPLPLPPLPLSPAPRPPSPPSQLASSSQEPVKKRKKKDKLAPGLALKKKGVSSLVAKWQQVREEAKKNCSSEEEDDDDVSSTHK